MKIYEVGGAVRDALLGLSVSERDWVVVGANPAEMKRMGFRQVGRDFPVFLHPETQEEYALARTERKTGAGYTGFAFHADETVTLEQDLMRRDLTINAMARDTDGRIIDPYGGMNDLRERKLRHVSPAFREDPLRVLRTARFAARFAPLGFEIEPATLAVMQKITEDGELVTLAAERVWQETVKGLETDRPDVYFEVLRRCAALETVFPEVDRLFGVPQPKRWHPEIDTGVHTLMALRMSAILGANANVRFAVLVHDLGKGTTPAEILPSHRGHEQRSVELLTGFCDRLKVPKSFRTLATHVARYHGDAHRADRLRPATMHDLLTRIGALRDAERLEEFCLACEADARGRTGLENAEYPQALILKRALSAALTVTADCVDPTVPAGPAVGAALRELRIAAIRRTLESQPPP